MSPIAAAVSGSPAAELHDLNLAFGAATGHTGTEVLADGSVLFHFEGTEDVHGDEDDPDTYVEALATAKRNLKANGYQV